LWAILPVAAPSQALEAQEKACLQKILPLEKKKSAVGEIGGIWTLFEQSPQLRDKSVAALQLDSQMNRVLVAMKYLCETLHGVPLNDLAEYVTNNLQLKSQKEFKAELIILGKTETEIDIWFAFAKFAQAHEKRALNQASVLATIAAAEPFFERYVRFADELGSRPQSQHRETALKFIQDIETFFEKDANLAQASFETAQVPYWDFEENYGGS
ncbi:MAG: hypothetical protein ACE5ER_08155, partial [Nitrospinaceae bacterium]